MFYSSYSCYCWIVSWELFLVAGVTIKNVCFRPEWATSTSIIAMLLNDSSHAHRHYFHDLMKAVKRRFFNTIIFKYSTKEEYQSLKNCRNRLSTCVCMNCFACSFQNKCRTTDPDWQKLVTRAGFTSLQYINFGKLCFSLASFRSYFEDCACVCVPGWHPKFFLHSISNLVEASKCCLFLKPNYQFQGST